MRLFSDYIIATDLRYEAHQLIYTPRNEDTFMLRGILAAAVFSTLIVDTEEGDRRGLALDSDTQREAWFETYEREMRRDNGGLFPTEVQALSEAYIELNGDMTVLLSICGNDRLYDLAFGLMVDYMRRLVREEVRDHIYELVPWTAPFAQWLVNAGYVETRRQHLLSINWADPSAVYALSEELSNPSFLNPNPLFVFEGERAADIMERYLQWLSDEYVAMKQEIPGAKITSADRKYIFSQETDWTFLADEMDQLDSQLQKEWNRWQQEWSRFLSERLLPMKEIRFWADDVPEEIQEHLLYHLQLAEQHPAHFRDLTTAVYAMRQLGYIRRKCPDRDIRQWLSEHLKLDYTERNNASQFRRAMKEHGRYTPEVRDEVILLESMGYFRFQTESSE